MLGLHPPKAKRRFTLLFLEEREIYIEDFSGFLHIPGPSAQPTPFLLRPVKRGRLHVCSKSLFFEPDDSHFPITKFSLSNISALQRQKIRDRASQTDQELLSLIVRELSHIQPNAPYTVTKLDVTASNSEYCVTLQYTELNKLMPLISRLVEIQSKVPARDRDDQLEQLIREREESVEFESSAIVDIRERVLLPAGRAIIASQVTPLLTTRGALLLTDARLYFQPFNHVSSEPVKKFELSAIKRVYKRRFIMRDTGLEFYFSLQSSKGSATWHGGARWQGGLSSSPSQAIASMIVAQQSAFFTFESSQQRDTILDIISRQSVFKPTKEFSLESMRDSWVRGEVSNYDYLMFVNQQAGRSFQDLCQYPVYPWVLADFTSQHLDLTKPETFRDLSKPIGALNPSRLEVFRKRMREMPKEMGTPFLYGSFYSTPGYVLYYLVRRAPQYQLKLQNGRFDQPDRLFIGIPQAWQSVLNGPADVKELIPEFYTVETRAGDFLLNDLGLELGVRQNGVEVDDVDLPPWAKSPKDFIAQCRLALESPCVSENLHHWIDLIFGYKQTGDEAVKADNLFYPLVYEGAVDLDALTDSVEKKSMEAQIMEFGQAPKKLFAVPHPKKLSRGGSTSVPKSLSGVEAVMPTTNSVGTESPRGRWTGVGSRQPSMDWTAQTNALSPSTKISVSSKRPTESNGKEKKKERKSVTAESAESSSTTSISERGSERKVVKRNDGHETTSASPTSATIAPPTTSSAPAPVPSQPLTNPLLFSTPHSWHPWRVDLTQLKRSSILSLHRDQVTSVLVSADNRALLTVGADAFLRVTNIDNIKEPARAIKLGEVTLTATTVVRDASNGLSSTAVVGAWDGRIHMFALSSSTVTAPITAHDDAISGLASFGSSVISASWDSTVKLWGVRESGLDAGSLSELAGHESSIKALAVNVDAMIAATGSEDGQLCVWDLRSKQRIHASTVGAEEITAIAASGASFIVASADQSLRMLSADGRQVWLKSLSHTTKAIDSDDSRAIIGDSDGVLRVFDCSNGRELLQHASHQGAVNSVTVSEDGSVIAVGFNRAKDNVGLWRVSH